MKPKTLAKFLLEWLNTILTLTAITFLLLLKLLSKKAGRRANYLEPEIQYYFYLCLPKK